MKVPFDNLKGRRVYQFVLDEKTGKIEDISDSFDYVKVRHARLLNASPYGECSCCSELIDSRDRFRYCPYCGAKLDGEQEKRNEQSY